MYRPRVIPVLLLHKNGKYIGDPINAVRIFNDLKVDKIILLDIDATKENRTISIDLVKDIGEEANMPFSVGGGIKDIDTINKLIHSGAERVILSTFAIENPQFVTEAANYFGASTICVCLDYKKKWNAQNKVYTRSGKKIVAKISKPLLKTCKMPVQEK